MRLKYELLRAERADRARAAVDENAVEEGVLQAAVQAEAAVAVAAALADGFARLIHCAN